MPLGGEMEESERNRHIVKPQKRIHQRNSFPGRVLIYLLWADMYIHCVTSQRYFSDNSDVSQSSSRENF